MDDTRTLRSLPAFLVGPGLHLHLAGSNEGLKVQQGVCLLDEAVHTTLLQAQLLQEELLVFIRLQLGNVLFCLGSNDHRLSTFLLGQCFNTLCESIAALGFCFAHVADVEHGFGGKQEQVAGAVLLVLRLKLHDAGVLALFQHLFVGLQHRHLQLGILVACSSGLLRLGQTAVDGLQVFQLQLRINDFLVADGVDGAVHMGDVLILKAAQHMDDGIRLANVAQELVAQALTLRGPFHQSGYIHYFAGGRNYPARMYQLGQFRQSLVGHRNHTHIGFYCTKRKIGCLCLGT